MANDSIAAVADHGVVRSADGTPLKVSLRRAIRRSKIRAALLVLPLFAFVAFTFATPIIEMLFRSVQNPEVHDYMPRTAEALVNWDGEAVPGEPVFAELAADLTAGYKTRDIGKVATRLNYEDAGMRSLIMKSARKAAKLEPPYKEALLDIDEDWGDPAVWRLIKRESGPYTLSYYLAAFDMQYSSEGEITAAPEYTQIYVKLFWRTLWMSALITLMTILLGYPVSYMLATLPLRYSNLLMILVLLPFWTSLLVRTTTWIAMLQSQGVINDILVAIGIISTDGRLQLIHNKIGTVVAMTHILLPFMILPLYSVMKTIPPSYLRAARSLGANPLVAFWRVYVPQTMAGVGAGSILVFILSIGYYITPALVGGQSGRFITNFIAYHMQSSLNWGLAAAISSILLLTVLVLYLLYNKLVGIDKMKLG
jgi:putative spermidine/putrescine transport system permease protein